MGVLTSILTPETIAGYVLLAFVAAFLGRKRLIGFWGFFFLSLIVTPFATIFFIFVATPQRKPRPAKPRPAKPRVNAGA